MAVNKQQSSRTKFPTSEPQRRKTFNQLNQNKKVDDIETLFRLVKDGSVTDGNKGDVIISNGGTVYELATASVTNDKVVSVDAVKVSQSPNFRLVNDAEKDYWNNIENDAYAIGIILG